MYYAVIAIMVLDVVIALIFYVLTVRCCERHRHNDESIKF